MDSLTIELLAACELFLDWDDHCRSFDVPNDIDNAIREAVEKASVELTKKAISMGMLQSDIAQHAWHETARAIQIKENQL